MAIDVGSADRPRKKREAAATRPKTTTRRAAKSKRTTSTRPSRESSVEPSSGVRESRRPRALERDSDSVPSNRNASRELVREQSSVSRDLVGSRTPRESSEESGDRGLFGRVADTVRGAVDAVTGSTEPAESPATEGASQADEESESRGFFGNLIDCGREVVADAAERRQEREAETTRQAQEAYQNFSQDPDALRSQLGEDGLGNFSDAERLAIAQLSQENEAIGSATERAVNSDIRDYENFADIPTDQASQILLNAYAGDEEAERLGTFLEDHLNSELDAQIERLGERGLKGDEQADGAIEGLLSDAESLARTHPALAGQLEDRFNSALESSAEQINDVRRNDDNWFQRRAHDISGGVRFLAGGLGDGLRFAVRGAGNALDFPQRLGADLVSGATELGGDLVGAGLDAVGAEGAADFVRDTSDTVSDGIQSVSEFQSRITQDVFTGVGEGAAVLVEGVGEALANPVGTVQGLATIANAANPLTLPIDIIRNGGNVVDALEERGEVFVGLGQGIAATYQATNEEHGGVAATSHALFDVVTTIGTGGVVAGGRTATTVASRLGNINRATRFADDVARLGDDAARLGSLGDDAARLGGLGDDATRLAGVGDSVAAQAAEAVAPARPRSPRRALSDEELSVQSRANDLLDADLDGFVERYRERFGNNLDLDDARELFDDFANSPEARSQFGTAIHGPSSRLIEEVFDRRLAEPVVEGTRPQVVFTAGGSGSGKSSVRGLPGNAIDNADFVFDSTLANFDRSLDRINQVLDSGRDVNISYVYRDPVDAFVNGVLPRAAESGRIVPIEAFSAIHQRVGDTVRRLSDQFAGDSRFSLDVIDNTRGRGYAAFSSLDDLPVQQIDNLTETLYNSLEEAFQRGDIPQHVYESFLRERPL